MGNAQSDLVLQKYAADIKAAQQNKQSPAKNIPIGNWTTSVQEEINDKVTASYIVGQPGGGPNNPIDGCQKRFTSTYQCGTGSTKEVNISPEAWGQAALFDCTAESKTCDGFKLTLGDDGNIIVTDGTNSTIWSSNTTKTGLALPQYSAKNGKTGRNYLLTSEVLNVGEFIGSPSGNCYLIMTATGLQLLYNMSGCTMTDENTGVSSDANSYATYSIPKVNVSSVGKVGYISPDGKLKEYPSELLGTGSTYNLVGNYDSLGNDIKQIRKSGTAAAAPVPTHHLDFIGKSLTWEASNAYAQSKGGRLATMAELRAYMTSKGGALLPGGAQWVAVTDGFNGANDWIFIGNVSHTAGMSQAQDFGPNAWWYSPGTNPTWNFYVFWISQAPAGQTAAPMSAPVDHLDLIGKSLTWEASNAYAQSKGGRLATWAELLAYIKSKGGALLPGKDQWVAVTNGCKNATDWIEIGNTNHPPGISQTKDFGSNAWWYSPGTNPTWNFYVFWISQAAAPAAPVSANPSSSFLNQCEQACNELGDCAGFVANADTCWLKNSGMFPTGLRQPNNDYELYTRNKTVKNNNSCVKTIENSTAANWELLPMGEKMSMNTLCNLGAITEQERKELEEKYLKLYGVTATLDNKLQGLTREKSKIEHSMKNNTGKLKSDMNNYKNVWNQADDNVNNLDNISGMLQDTDLNMVSQNYKHMLWTILAILIIIGGIRMTRNSIQN